ncbi:MAG: enoyl-CoA hydratase/isomerase family protein [Bacteroidetes bacterium]|nr:enoyl-CoA hydratase/isomerase family protein [Bacteroidota bacterium]
MTEDKYTERVNKEGIGILTLKNPPQNYLMEPEFISRQVLDEWIRADELKGLVIAGAGRHFSGGARLEDIFSMAEAEAPMEVEMEKGKNLLSCIRELNIPVIAAINGVCFGGGLEIALACHIRFCTENALFAFPESNHGLMPGLGGTVMLGERLPFPESLKMILGGDMINAEEALSMKIVDSIIKASDPVDYSLGFLKKITEGRSLIIIHYVMQALKNAKELPPEDALKEETRMFAELARQEAKNRSRRPEV